MPLLQIRREGLQCYTLMSTSHTRELTAKGGSTPPLSYDQEKKKKKNLGPMCYGPLDILSSRIGLDQNLKE